MLMNKELVCITLDSDWAPKEVVNYCLNLLSKYNVKATFFLTNDLDLDFGKHEISLHPNFLSVSRNQTDMIKVSSNEKKIILDLLSFYKKAQGIRTHSLYYFNRLNELFSSLGLSYMSNIEMPFQPNINPFITRNNLVQFPIYFMDDFILKNEKYVLDLYGELFNSKNYVNGTSGLKVFDFHPVHIFLNTKSNEHYMNSKKYYHDYKRLENRRFKGKGMGTLFEEILSLISSKSLDTKTLIEVEKSYRLNNK